MSTFVLAYEPIIRLAAFLLVFAAVAGGERLAPRRPLQLSRLRRWVHNLGLTALNVLLLRLLFPAAAVGVAAWAAAQQWGWFNVVEAPAGLAIVVSVVLLDLVIYLQHVLFHAVPLLWRLHRVHHADLDFDVTTGARFHPIEILLSMLIKFAAILLLGPPLVAVVIFEVLLNATAMFNHGNLRLPPRLDHWLRWVVVTPDMHRVHHSVADDEANSNFGFNLPWWDRLFGTYRDQPRGGHQGMTIGIHTCRDPRIVARLPGMLWLPFRRELGTYPLNRRSWAGPGEGRGPQRVVEQEKGRDGR